MIDIIICDDHNIVREGLRQILEQKKEFNIIADVSSGEELFECLRNKKADIVLLDIALPGRSGLEVLKQLQSSFPSLKVLTLSMYPEDQFAIRMMKAGSKGYLHKDSAPEILYEAIEQVVDNKIYLNSSISGLLLDEVLSKKSDKILHQQLSDREYEVLLMLGEGKRVGDIANSLSLSVKTISTYKTRILEKLKLDNLSDLIKYVMTHHLAIHE